jgi:hypothetical protein
MPDESNQESTESSPGTSFLNKHQLTIFMVVLLVTGVALAAELQFKQFQKNAEMDARVKAAMVKIVCATKDMQLFAILAKKAADVTGAYAQVVDLLV